MKSPFMLAALSRILKAILLASVSCIFSCTTVRTRDLSFGMSDLSGARRVAFYDGEPVQIFLNWEVGLDTGRVASCSIRGALDGTMIWSGVGRIPEIGSNLRFNPPFPVGGLKPPIGAYITECTFFDGGGSGSVQFSVSPVPKR